MEKPSCNKTTTLYDVAPGPVILLLLGVPLLIVVAVVGIIIVAVVLIRRARKINLAKANPENGTPGDKTDGNPQP
jgi:hypothetical protein